MSRVNGFCSWENMVTILGGVFALSGKCGKRADCRYTCIMRSRNDRSMSRGRGSRPVTAAGKTLAPVTVHNWSNADGFSCREIRYRNNTIQLVSHGRDLRLQKGPKEIGLPFVVLQKFCAWAQRDEPRPTQFSQLPISNSQGGLGLSQPQQEHLWNVAVQENNQLRIAFRSADDHREQIQIPTVMLPQLVQDILDYQAHPEKNNADNRWSPQSLYEQQQIRAKLGAAQTGADISLQQRLLSPRKHA